MGIRKKIIEALQEYLKDNSEPTLIKLPLKDARDLCNASADELGGQDLKNQLEQHGPFHLEKTGLLGKSVKVIDNPDAQIEFE